MTEVLECYTERNRKKADFTILLSFCTQFANVNLTRRSVSRHRSPKHFRQCESDQRLSLR